MSWLAFVPLFIAPADTAPATAHERVLAPRILPLAATKELAAGDPPKSVWRVDSSGSATHWQSTMNCPATMKSFRRKDLIPFDGYGLDVGCNFDRPEGDAVITVYLTRRAGPSLAENFASAQEALKQRLPEAKPIAGDVPMPKGQTFTGALYELDDGTRTGVWVADVSGWTFKFRATYRSDIQADVLDAMSDLSEKARATAGTHLAACAAAPAVQRNGTQITDKDRLTSLSIVGAVTAIDDDEKAVAKIPEQWCVEDPAGDREIPMLFWRNIANKSGAGAMDRMSFMTVSEPPILFSEANPLASEVDEKSKAGKVIVHQLTLIQNDTTYIFAFYSGRPAAATIAPLAKDLVLNKKAPIASYTKGTNTITLPMAKAKPGKLKQRGQALKAVETHMPKAHDAQTLAFYATEAAAYAARSDRIGRSKKLEAFIARLEPGAAVLDLGCGTGRDTQALIEAGFAVTALDGSSAMAQEAERRIGKPVRVQLFEDIADVAAFDGIWANASLLHVPREGLARVLNAVYRALKPGGLLFASFKGGGREGRDTLGRYYNYLDARDVRALIEGMGPWRALTLNEGRGKGYDGTETPWTEVLAEKSPDSAPADAEVK